MSGSVIWLFGKSGAGKTTLGEKLARELGYLFLDADVVRKLLRTKPDFSENGRILFQNALRYHVWELHWKNNNMVVASITPLVSMRERNRYMLNNYTEVYLECATEVLVHRDPKGLYKKAAAGEIDNMFLFEEPILSSPPDIRLRTDQTTIESSFKELIHQLGKDSEG